ncbi:kelch-like protein 2 [Acyrthosiphon pisum]|uniref:Kelch-like protein diablo n=1 Tax=Acyrthosiphon pisum TaxID=7029 RepID=A0A8R2JLH8_ACYPI|nr:kelch-like protein 2 [Acyrthosiphon pisum]
MQNTHQIPESRRCEPAKLYKKSSFVDIYAALQFLRNGEIFCDIKLETDENNVIFAHKVVLASASPYFYAMFTNFSERNSKLVVLKQIDSTALQLLVNFIYSGEILITEKNIQVLLPAADFLQLQEVKEACCDFAQTLLCPNNCIGIYAIADLHGCTKLLTSSELYIQQHFSEVVGGNEFLSLSSEQVVRLISSDKLIVPSEEKKMYLPQLMEYVRLPLTSKSYISKKVVEEPLIKNCLKCKDYIDEALHFHNIHKSEKLIPQNIRNKPRHGDNVILIVGGYDNEYRKITEWYDPKMDRWNYGPEMITSRVNTGVCVVNDNLVFAVGGYNYQGEPLRSVDMLDLTSDSLCWKPSVDMLVKRSNLGVCAINNYYIYAVGGSTLQSDTVECYYPSLDTWNPVAKMSVHRRSAGVGVLNGVLYVVGGHNGFKCLSSVEAYTPSTGVWTTIADMHMPRHLAGIALDDLLYVVGGEDETSFLDSTECYNPKTNTWSLVAASMNHERTSIGGVAFNRPRHFKNGFHL